MVSGKYSLTAREILGRDRSYILQLDIVKFMQLWQLLLKADSRDKGYHAENGRENHGLRDPDEVLIQPLHLLCFWTPFEISLLKCLSFCR